MPVVFLYCHNGRSYGHLRKLGNIAYHIRRLRPDVDLMCITSSVPPAGFFPPEVDLLKLPSYRLVETSSGFRSYPLIRLPYGKFIEFRADLISLAVRRYKPDVLVVDDDPFGKSGELERAISRRTAMKCFMLFNGVADHRERTRRQLFHTGFYQSIHERFEKVLINCDAQVFDPITYYGVPQQWQHLFKFTGYIVNPTIQEAFGHKKRRRRKSRRSSPRVLVQMGGGGGAESLLTQVVEAKLDRVLSTRFFFEIYAGERFDERVFAEIVKGAKCIQGLRLRRFCSNMAQAYRRADLIVSAGGYNSLTEILATQKPSLIIPRQLYEKEQEIHSNAMATKGLVLSVLPIEQVTPEVLAEYIKEALKRPEPRRAIDVRLDGGLTVAQEVLSACRS